MIGPTFETSHSTKTVGVVEVSNSRYETVIFRIFGFDWLNNFRSKLRHGTGSTGPGPFDGRFIHLTFLFASSRVRRSNDKEPGLPTRREII